MSPRKLLAKTGERGNLLRLFLEERGGVKRYVVQWGPKGARQQDSWPHTKDGKKEAETFFKSFEAEAKAAQLPVEPLTTRQLWTAYLTAESEHLRPRSRALYAESWRAWEQHYGTETIAQAVTIQQIANFRKALDSQGLATATVKNCIRNVRIVYNWAERMELIDRNRWHLFVHKVAKEKRTKPRAEYSAGEFASIWNALDRTKVGQWRAWALTGLLGIYGNRQNEILNLRWSWIDGDIVRIDEAVVKTGEEKVLQLFPLTRGILDVCREWARREEYRGDMVFYPAMGGGMRSRSTLEHYSIQSLTDQIHRAEHRAGVTHIKYRAGHGFRRGLVGDLAETTGDVQFALQAIGDRDVRMATNYRVKRNTRVNTEVQKRAERILGEGATKVQPTPENETQASGVPGAPASVTSTGATT